MSWIVLAASAAISWGLYGASLHRGQTELGNPMRAMLCVGVAYFLIAVLVPSASLTARGEWSNFSLSGTATATIAGALGALGAVCITFAFRAGGSPMIVMPLVFGGAPLINVLSTMIMHPPKTAPNAMFYLGVLMVASGAGMVLHFRPST